MSGRTIIRTVIAISLLGVCALLFLARPALAEDPETVKKLLGELDAEVRDCRAYVKASVTASARTGTSTASEILHWLDIYVDKIKCLKGSVLTGHGEDLGFHLREMEMASAFAHEWILEWDAPSGRRPGGWLARVFGSTEHERFRRSWDRAFDRFDRLLQHVMRRRPARVSGSFTNSGSSDYHGAFGY
ncbi:MAG: hypothetical protein HY815_08440 [Candidatus Riflebacteria bacterium]|nr:hypothetical protein [Candidatus Riflebacteria bacterium]